MRTPSISCILKHVEISFDDGSKSTKMNLQEIITLELVYSRNNPIIHGIFSFKDLRDIGTAVDIKNATIEVYFNDNFNKTLFRRFKIVEMSESYTDNRTKLYMMFIIDEISFELNNIYLSKSFSKSRVAAFESILKEYKIFDILSKTSLKYEFTPDDNIAENASFVLTSNISVLDFFIEEFEKIGYSFYQTRDGLYIKNFDDLTPDKLEEIEDEFVQENKNKLYKNIIYEVINSPGSNSTALANPSKKTYYFDESKKQMVSIDDNFDNIKSTISLNNDVRNFQINRGNKSEFQNRLDSAQHKNSIRENYLRTFQISIIVNGFVNNDINKIYNVQLQGYKGNSKTQIEGNIISSGKYVGLHVTDKLIGDKLLQKITMGRSDSQK